MSDDNHVIGIRPDDESVMFEMNRELGGQEQREINRRVRWARERREAEQRSHETTEGTA